jgi:hypothetical protein
MHNVAMIAAQNQLSQFEFFNIRNTEFNLDGSEQPVQSCCPGDTIESEIDS